MGRASRQPPYRRHYRRRCRRDFYPGDERPFGSSDPWMFCSCCRPRSFSPGRDPLSRGICIIIVKSNDRQEYRPRRGAPDRAARLWIEGSSWRRKIYTYILRAYSTRVNSWDARESKRVAVPRNRPATQASPATRKNWQMRAAFLKQPRSSSRESRGKKEESSAARSLPFLRFARTFRRGRGRCSDPADNDRKSLGNRKEIREPGKREEGEGRARRGGLSR